MPTGSIALPVIFIDADGFKQINDVYSHETGDQALVLIAETLKQNLRSNDILGRFSGDEFIVFLPYTNQNEALSFSKKIRENCYRFSRKRPYLSALSLMLPPVKNPTPALKT